MYGMPCLSSRWIPLASAKYGGSVDKIFSKYVMMMRIMGALKYYYQVSQLQ